MILSQTAEYALKAMIYIAEQERSGRVRIDDAANALAVPRNYLSKILHALGQEGLLRSTRGPGGGFALARAPEEVRLADIVRPFDAVVDSSGCLLGRDRCSEADPCAAHDRWREIHVRVLSFLRETTLRDLAGPEDRTPDAPAVEDGVNA